MSPKGQFRKGPLQINKIGLGPFFLKKYQSLEPPLLTVHYVCIQHIDGLSVMICLFFYVKPWVKLRYVLKLAYTFSVARVKIRIICINLTMVSFFVYFYTVYISKPWPTYGYGIYMLNIQQSLPGSLSHFQKPVRSSHSLLRPRRMRYGLY